MAALLEALKRQDDDAVIAIFGAQYADEILGQDRDAAHEEQARFVAAAEQSLELRPDGTGRRVAYVGPRASPLPIPIVQSGGAWRFDTEAGIDELLNRRIGRNELSTIDSVRAYVEAQNEYASEDRDGDQVLEYAQHIRSSPGQHDGLYWPSEGDQAQSPIGPLLAAAVETHDVGDAFNGYHYRILTRQGAHPPGGRLRLRDQRQHDRGLRADRLAGRLREFGDQDLPGQPPGQGVREGPRSRHGPGGGGDRGLRSDATWTEVTE